MADNDSKALRSLEYDCMVQFKYQHQTVSVRVVLLAGKSRRLFPVLHLLVTLESDWDQISFAWISLWILKTTSRVGGGRETKLQM